MQDTKFNRTSSSSSSNATRTGDSAGPGKYRINTHVLTLIMFHAPWCTISKEFLPDLRQIGKVHASDLQVVKIDVDKNASAALKFGIRSTPTYLLVKDNNELWRRAGKISRQELEEKLHNLL